MKFMYGSARVGVQRPHLTAGSVQPTLGGSSTIGDPQIGIDRRFDRFFSMTSFHQGTDG